MEHQVVTCVYCGYEYPNGTPTAKHKLLTEHIKICKKHPMRESGTKIELLKNALIGLVGAEKKEELDKMEILMRSAQIPNSDKVNMINAIDAIRRCDCLAEK